MSHVLSDDDQHLAPLLPFDSYEFDSTANTPAMEMENNPELVVIEDDAENLKSGLEQANVANNDEPTPFTKRKRKFTSGVWAHFRAVTLADGVQIGILMIAQK